jgi:CubicO group peptidase (beta-lactamase class C family)
MPLDKFAEANVYAPLGLKHTGFLPPKSWIANIAPTQFADEQMATPVGQAMPMMAKHEVKRGIVHDPTSDRMGGVAGHAGLFSCADDVAVIAQSLLDHKSVISALTIDKMTAPNQPPNQTQLRGLAWDIDTSYSTNRGALLPIGSYGHTGFTGTSLWIDPASDTYIVILANGVHPHGKGSAVSLRSRPTRKPLHASGSSTATTS